MKNMSVSEMIHSEKYIFLKCNLKIFLNEGSECQLIFFFSNQNTHFVKMNQKIRIKEQGTFTAIHIFCS